MLALLLTLIVPAASGFCEDTTCLTAPAARTEVAAEVGLLDTGYLHTTGASADLFGFAGAAARIRNQTLSWLLVEVAADGLLPLSHDGAHAGAAGVARVGYGGSKWAWSLGVNAHLDDTPKPFAVLPSVSVTFRPGLFAVTLGVLDRPVGPLAHLTVEVGSFGLGYSAPLGFEAFARLRLRPSLALHLSAFAHQVFQSFAIGGSVGLVFGKGTVFDFGGGA